MPHERRDEAPSAGSEPSARVPGGGLAALAAALVAAHVLWGLARVPGKVVQRRLADVAAYRERGAPTFLLEDAHLRGAPAIEWVRAHVPADAVVLWAGDGMKALEFAPALLAPRLLVAIDRCPPGTVTWLGRQVARTERSALPGGGGAGTGDGGAENGGSGGVGEGAVVLVGVGDDIRLEVR